MLSLSKHESDSFGSLLDRNFQQFFYIRAKYLLSFGVAQPRVLDNPHRFLDILHPLLAEPEREIRTKNNMNSVAWSLLLV